MRGAPDHHGIGEVFSIVDIAHAAGVRGAEAAARLRAWGITLSGRYVSLPEAVRLVRILTGRATPTDADRTPMRYVEPASRRATGSLVASGLLHTAAVLVLMTAATLGLLSAPETENIVRRPPAPLVYTVSLGPGGGGGGGGLEAPLPPPRAERESPIEKVSSPVPEPRRIPPPPRRPVPRPAPPVRLVRPEPIPTPPRPTPPPPTLDVVVAPVAQVPGDARSVTGLLAGAPAPAVPSPGAGTGGGVGTGAGTGLGEGRGSGIGPGSGGGTGGGPFRPGSGIAPPTLTHEVRPDYTTEARRQAIEGDVELEIVVRADGRVGDVRLVRGLGAGLDQKAIEAVRQWRFSPARRQGAPVDVVVQVSVAFTLR